MYKFPTELSPLNMVPFLRTWASLRPYSHSEVNQQRQKVTQTQEMSIFMILHSFISPAWEWMNFLNVFRKPSRHIYLTSYTELALGRSVTSLLGQITNILFRFFFSSPQPSLYLSARGTIQAVPSGLSELLSLLLQEGWGGHQVGTGGPGRRGWYPNTHWVS